MQKEGRKQGQTNNKAKQHSTPKTVTYPKKNELPQLGLEPTTLYTLDRGSSCTSRHVYDKYALILWEPPPQHNTHNTHNIRHLGYRIYVHVQYKPESVIILYTCIYLHHTIHVLMRDERRKKERSKQRQTNKQGKATQHTQAHVYTCTSLGVGIFFCSVVGA